MKILGWLCLAWCALIGQVEAQPLFRITVQAGDVGYADYPLSLPIDAWSRLPGEGLRLMEVGPDGRVEVPFQVVEWEGAVRIDWLLAGAMAPGTQRVYELEHGLPAVVLHHEARETAEDLLLRTDLGQDLLSYRHALYPAPIGSNPLYARAGFVHPLNTPAGHALTRIQPPDHIHHYGLWNSWTRLEYGDQSYGLWNLHLNQGTVRFAGFDAVYGGPVTAGFVARHAHVIFEEGAEEQVLEEKWFVQVFPQGASRYTCDIESLLMPAGRYDVRLQEYRYGGLVLRLREDWTPASSEIRLSSGRTRDEGDGSAERWVLIQGDLPEGKGGLLIMASPTNSNFPEPIRLWPSDANDGKGDIMF